MTAGAVDSCFASPAWAAPESIRKELAQQGRARLASATWLPCFTADARASLLLALPDEDVGAVLGKKGQTLTQIQQVGLGWAPVPSISSCLSYGAPTQD